MTNMRNELTPIYLWSNGVCLNSEPKLLCTNSFWLTYCAEKHWSFVFQGKLFAQMSNIQQIFVNGQIFITKKIFPNGISKFILPNAIVIQSANLDLILLSCSINTACSYKKTDAWAFLQIFHSIGCQVPQLPEVVVGEPDKSDTDTFMIIITIMGKSQLGLSFSVFTFRIV